MAYGLSKPGKMQNLKKELNKQFITKQLCKENKFLKSCQAVAAMAGVPFNLAVKHLLRLRVSAGFMVDTAKSRSGKQITLMEGDTFFTKVSEGVAKDMTEAEQDKFREEHGFKRVGPAIKNFKKM